METANSSSAWQPGIHRPGLERPPGQQCGFGLSITVEVCNLGLHYAPSLWALPVCLSPALDRYMTVCEQQGFRCAIGIKVCCSFCFHNERNRWHGCTLQRCSLPLPGMD